MATTAPRRPAFIPSIIYKDNRAALKWLQKAFGFEPSEVLTDSKDNILHAEMTHDDGVIMVGTEFATWAKSPESVGGSNTQRLHVRLTSGLDDHCERAREHGAEILMEPIDFEYGERQYSAQDPAGHHWTFSQAVKQVSTAQMEQATGFKFKPLK